MAMKKTFVILLVALGLPLTAYAAAPSHFDDVSVKVSYADLNIDNAAGAKVLYSRLRDAAEQVCGLGPKVKLGLPMMISGMSFVTSSMTSAGDTRALSFDVR